MDECSEHKWNIKCFASISDVKSTIYVAITLMVGVESWPKLAPQNGSSAHGVLQNGPAAYRDVTVCVV